MDVDAIPETLSIYDILRTDHRMVLQALNAIEQINDENRRKDLFAFVRTQLMAHSRAEEDVFYTPLKQRLGDTPLMQSSYGEHQRLDELLVKLNHGSADADWMNNLRELRMVLLRHVQREETEAFPAGQKVFSDSEAQEIGIRLLEEKGKVDMPNPVAAIGKKLKQAFG